MRAGTELPSLPVQAGPLSTCLYQEVNSYWLLNKWLQCVGVRGLFPCALPSLDKHVLTEQLHTNSLGEILHIVPQAADKWDSYTSCKHERMRTHTHRHTDTQTHRHRHTHTHTRVYTNTTKRFNTKHTHTHTHTLKGEGVCVKMGDLLC